MQGVSGAFIGRLVSGCRAAARALRTDASGEPPVTASEPSGSRYTLLGRVAGGGAATVYRGWDRERGIPVALKCLCEEAPADGWAARHLLREAEVAGRFSHPALVRLLEVVPGDRPCLIFEYLPGGTLRRAVRARRLRPSALLRSMIEVAGGLAYLHREGWVHADVKPSNLLFDGAGHVKLIDFGLTVRTGQPTLDEGAVACSAGYAPPEQTAGLPLTPASDVYSLCVVLYEALTGTRFGVGSEAGILRRVEGLPSGLDRVLRVGLAADPAARYADGATLAEALEGCRRRFRVHGYRASELRPAWSEVATAPQIA
jgi:serine/threonine protein kinase